MRCRVPRAIRYPRGGESKALAQYGCSGKEYDHLYTAPGAKIVLVSYADEVEDVLNAAKLLGAENIPCDVYKLVKIFPFTEELIREIMRYDVVLMAEECVACGGIGEHLEMALQHAGWNGRYIHTAVEQLCLPHATVPQIKQVTGLDAEHWHRRCGRPYRPRKRKERPRFENSIGPISGAARTHPEP